MKIFIDGDGSPIKDTVIEFVEETIPVIIVTSIAHYSHKEYPKNVQVVYVDQGVDAADYRIIQLIKANDLLITQDYGLASLVLPKKVRVLHHLGYEYTCETIDTLLENRHFNHKIRKSGGKVAGPKVYTEEDRKKFKAKLKEVIHQIF